MYSADSPFFLEILYFFISFAKLLSTDYKLNINNMEKFILLSYEAPVVEIIEVEVEKGFATSSGNAPEWDESYDFNNN